MERERWYPLTAAGLPDYLEAIGLVRLGDRPSINRTNGRNRVFEVRLTGDAQVRWFVKQFGSQDRDGDAFSRELSLATNCPQLPLVQPVGVDRSWRILITPSAGRSLYSLLRDEEPLPYAAGSSLRTALATTQSASPDATPHFPSIFTWLTTAYGEMPASFAQRRLVATLASEPTVRRVLDRAAKLWHEHNSDLVLSHGDLKLEHIIINPTTGSAHIIDWEFARAGPRGWDYAGVLQSVLANIVLGIIDWSADVRTFTTTALGDADIERDDLDTLVALRLWQTAVEWETDEFQSSSGSGRLCQLGISLADDPSRILELLAANA